MNSLKSEQIKHGLQSSFASGKSAKAETVCYGYKVTNKGELIAYPTEAVVVFYIFDKYIDGASLGQIVESLARLNILSPTGKERWNREAILKMLSNEKYTGDVILQKTVVKDGVQVPNFDEDTKIRMEDHHQAIIPREMFAQAQTERARRSRAKRKSQER